MLFLPSADQCLERKKVCVWIDTFLLFKTIKEWPVKVPRHAVFARKAYNVKCQWYHMIAIHVVCTGGDVGILLNIFFYPLKLINCDKTI